MLWKPKLFRISVKDDEKLLLVFFIIIIAF